MAGERYYLTAGGVRSALPASFKPSTLSPRAPSFNLVRARGSTEVFDLSDGLPDPQPFVLVGRMKAANEAGLSALLASWAAHVKACTALDRDGRRTDACKGGALVAVPIGENSAEAEVTITLILANVPTGGANFF